MGRRVFAVGVAVVLVAGCASDPSDVPTAATEPPPGEQVSVEALDNSFRAQDITVAVGTTVTWENVGRNDHNVIPDPKSIQGWGVSDTEFGPGATYSHTFSEPGVYAYVCTIHGLKGKGMVGTVTVTA